MTAALYGALYLDRGEGIENALQQIDALASRANEASLFAFDVIYGPQHGQLAAQCRREILCRANERLPGVEASCSVLFAPRPGVDPRHSKEKDLLPRSQDGREAFLHANECSNLIAAVAKAAEEGPDTGLVMTADVFADDPDLDRVAKEYMSGAGIHVEFVEQADA
ncbi:MAG TPA: hypothetical protein VN889_03605 [Solirubrobacteraceae bacterium]|nr:hypothetical protein [Solirubrobacteraceae bacterium]